MSLSCHFKGEGKGVSGMRLNVEWGEYGWMEFCGNAKRGVCVCVSTIEVE